MAVAGGDSKVDEMTTRVLDEYQGRIGVPLPKLSFKWVTDSDDTWRLNGYEVPIANGKISDTDQIDDLSNQLSEALTQFGHLFVGIQEVSELLAATAESYPDIVKEAVRALPTQSLAIILRNMVEEDISIRNLRAILEALINAADREKDTNNLTELARCALSREISHRYAPDGALDAIVFSPQLEEHLANSMRSRPGVQQMALDPATAEKICNDLLDAIKAHEPTVILTSINIRRACRTVFGGSQLGVPILSYGELVTNTKLDIKARIELDQTPNLRSVSA